MLRDGKVWSLPGDGYEGMVMYGYVRMAMYVWQCMYACVCMDVFMAMCVWLCMYGYVCMTMYA